MHLALHCSETISNNLSNTNCAILSCDLHVVQLFMLDPSSTYAHAYEAHVQLFRTYIMHAGHGLPRLSTTHVQSLV